MGAGQIIKHVKKYHLKIKPIIAAILDKFRFFSPANFFIRGFRQTIQYFLRPAYIFICFQRNTDYISNDFLIKLSSKPLGVEGVGTATKTILQSLINSLFCI